MLAYLYIHVHTLTLSFVHACTRTHLCRAAVMRQFHHPHIIRLFGVVQEQAILIVMELAPIGQVYNQSLSLSLSLSPPS